ncbi:hypothetical protein HORIV_19200 [Vreelandella olivaria]|uniref:Uncharacterized protein n=1 Tax=Vreelandella olivaria TaxID=390919 RepID=A0ABM7GG08_9GAMM|nr:hypothetical protein HORIV_19200 [Halomonas olivaria]
MLPGELEGAPVLQFFPLPQLDASQHNTSRETLEALPANSLYATLAARFRYYQQQVVKPFIAIISVVLTAKLYWWMCWARSMPGPSALKIFPCAAPVNA